MWGASERKERPASVSTRARVVSIAGIEVLMLSSAIPIQAVAPCCSLSLLLLHEARAAAKVAYVLQVLTGGPYRR